MAYGAKEQQIPEIRQVTPLPDYRLKLEFTSGSLLILNMADIVGSIRYFPLTDVGIFNSVTTDGWTLTFDTYPRFSINPHEFEGVELVLRVPYPTRVRIEHEQRAKENTV